MSSLYERSGEIVEDLKVRVDCPKLADLGLMQLA
jgi:hypothetical protein